MNAVARLRIFSVLVLLNMAEIVIPGAAKCRGCLTNLTLLREMAEDHVPGWAGLVAHMLAITFVCGKLFAVSWAVLTWWLA